MYLGKRESEGMYNVRYIYFVQLLQHFSKTDVAFRILLLTTGVYIILQSVAL